MNGSEAMVRTMLAAGVDVCFANPGTSEMHFVAALDKLPQMRCVLGLFEGVVTGAADGYYRMADKPAATLLHLGPGLGNGLANLHNAKRAHSGIVNIVGQHSLDHLTNDAPLTSDIEGVARPMSHWVRTTMTAEAAPTDTAAAIEQANKGRIATLILPADAAWGDCEAGARGAPQPAQPQKVDGLQIDAIARIIRNARNPAAIALCLGGRAMRAEASEIAGRIAAHTGCRLLAETKSPRAERGLGRMDILKIPYPLDPSLVLLQDLEALILVGTGLPVAFFGYPGKPRLLMPPGSSTHVLANPGQDIHSALEDLCEAVGAGKAPPALSRVRAEQSDLPTGIPDPEGVARVLAAVMPENAIVVDEAVTTGRMFSKFSGGAAPHDWLDITGGSIGYGLPSAVGAAIAAPNRKVIAVIGDGCAMYTLQALWTMAREGLDVLVVICANRTYKILNGELAAMGVTNPGSSALRMLSLDTPPLDWVSLARGHGVEGRRAESLAVLTREMRAAMAERGPRLIELVL
jgi:acetolactate synthase I/II/III large subunit